MTEAQQLEQVRCLFCEREGLEGPPCKQVDSMPAWMQEEYHKNERSQRLETERRYGKENVRHFTGGSAVRDTSPLGASAFLYGMIVQPAKEAE